MNFVVFTKGISAFIRRLQHFEIVRKTAHKYLHSTYVRQQKINVTLPTLTNTNGSMQHLEEVTKPHLIENAERRLSHFLKNHKKSLCQSSD